jgi:hypothetical protein
MDNLTLDVMGASLAEVASTVGFILIGALVI